MKTTPTRSASSGLRYPLASALLFAAIATSPSAHAETYSGSVASFTGLTATTNSTITFTGTGGTSSAAINQGNLALSITASPNGAFTYNGTYTGGTGQLTLLGTSAATITHDFQSKIGGSGALNKNSTATWKLSNDSNDFTGQTLVAIGKLIVTSIGNTGTASSVGAGTQVLRFGSGANNGTLEYVGSGHSSNRTIQIGSGNGLGTATILSNGTGGITFTAATANTAFNSAVANTTAGSRTLTLGGANTGANSIGGKIVDNTGLGGVINVAKADAGTWILGGNNTYTGTTSVSGGTLLINGNNSSATGAVTVASGATLGGSGTIGGATTVNGTLAAGNSPGLLTFSSSLNLASGSTTTMELAGLGNVAGTDFDKIVVGGAITFGGSLNIVSFNSYNINQETSYDLFDFASQSGAFSSVTVAGTGLTNSAGIWSGTDSGFNYSFSQSNGILSVTSAVPEPSTYAALAGLGILMFAIYRRRGTKKATS